MRSGHRDAALGRALRSRPARTALTSAGVAFATVLVLVLLAAYRSLAGGVVAFVGQREIDLWVAPQGSDNLIRSSGWLPMGTADAVRAVPGVAVVDPLLRSFVTVRPARPGPRAARLTLLALGYRTPGGLGGPRSIVTGRPPRGFHEVMLDRAAAHRLGVRRGDTVWVNGRTARVTGLTRGTNLFATQLAFADVEAAAMASGFAGRASFFAVRLAPGAPPPAAAKAIERRAPGTVVFPRDQFVANNVREIAEGLVPLLLLIALLGLLVAAVLVALLTQGLMEERRGDIAVLLALGAGAGAVARGIIGHVATLVLAGWEVGFVLAHALGVALDRFLPTVELSYRGSDLLATLATVAAAGVVAALAPVLRLRRVDPVEAFRA